MANEIISVNFSSIESCSKQLEQVSTTIQTKMNELSSCYSSLDDQVKTEMGKGFNNEELQSIKQRLDKIKDFLIEVKRVYSMGEIDSSSLLSVDSLEMIYPYFNELTDERKAIVLSALRYLGLNASQMGYGQNFSSNYASSQFIGDATQHAWCAMFVGSIINYFYGDKSIIDPSYASVWKIIGNYKNQTGIAFEEDERIHYYLSQALVEKYKATLNADGSCGLKGWEENLKKYNAEHGTNLKVTDWIKDGFVPEPGDILTFKEENHQYEGINRNDSLEEYNRKTDVNKASFIADTSSRDYPDDNAAYTHIGFVLGTREVDGVKYVDTVEGNVGVGVQVRSFRIDDPYIVGYGHIDYESFESDKNAIQEMLSTGVDTNASKATVGSVTTHLLALKTDDVKGNYLVNLANSIDSSNMEKSTLVTTSKVGTIAQTSATTNIETNVAQTLGNNNTNSVVSTNTTQTTNMTQNTNSYSTGGTNTYQTYSNNTSYSTNTSTVQASTNTSTGNAISNIETTKNTTVSIPSIETTQQEVVNTPATVEVVVTPQETVEIPVQSENYYVEQAPVENTIVENPPVIEQMTESIPQEESKPIENTTTPILEQSPPEEIEKTISIPNISTIPEVTVMEEKKNSPISKYIATALGVGAAAGGGYYAYSKRKKNKDNEEEDEEEEDYDEYQFTDADQ